jgi:hypothetical protein
MEDTQRPIATAIITPTIPAPTQPMGKFKSGWMLFKQSLAVLRQDKELLWFPVLNFFFSTIAFGIFFFFFVLGELSSWSSSHTITAHRLTSVILVFLYYLMIAFISTYFKGALTVVAYSRLSGEMVSFSDGVHASNQKIGKIMMWSLISATVGILLSALERRAKWLGMIISMIAGTAWKLATFFIVPSLMLEEGNVVGGLKQSTITFKKTWGEVFVSSVSFGFIFFLLMFVPLIIGIVGVGFFGLLQTSSIPPIITGSIVVWLLWVIFLASVSSALTTIFTTALYMYAKSGIAPIQFSPELISQAIISKI